MSDQIPSIPKANHTSMDADTKKLLDDLHRQAVERLVPKDDIQASLVPGFGAIGFSNRMRATARKWEGQDIACGTPCDMLMESADEVDRLQREIDRLSAALTQFVDRPPTSDDDINKALDAAQLAITEYHNGDREWATRWLIRAYEANQKKED